MKVPIRFGISIHTRDGHAGNLERIVVASDDDQPLLLVLYPDRALPRQHLIAVPVSLITGISLSRVMIAASLDELVVSGQRASSVSLKKPTWELKGGAAVVDAVSRTVGQVQGVVLDSGQRLVSHLMVRHQEYYTTPQNCLIPTFLITHIAPDAVHLYIAADYDSGLALTDSW